MVTLIKRDQTFGHVWRRENMAKETGPALKALPPRDKILYPVGPAWSGRAAVAFPALPGLGRDFGGTDSCGTSPEGEGRRGPVAH